MFAAIAKSIRYKLMWVVMATTFTALLVSAAAMVVYDLSNFRQNVAGDLTTQADIVARASAPALAFEDKKAAQANLALLRVRPLILSAAIYAQDGSLFASYLRAGNPQIQPPTKPGAEGYQIAGDHLRLFHRIVENGENVGTVYIDARYQLRERLQAYLQILFGVMTVALLVAALISIKLQTTITRPILAVAQVARHVMERRDFSLRVTKATEDEIGVLVEAFNDMLSEVGRRAAALESSNASLQHEMSVRRTAEDALREADRRKDEFLATLAHELRNPLAPLQTSLEILRLNDKADPSTQAALVIMARQLNQMIRLVDDLLDVSRITTGKLAVRTEPVTLQTIMQSAMETVQPLVEAGEHELEYDAPRRLVYLDADPVRLAQVFSNLLNNAVKFTPKHGKLAFRAEREEQEVVVTVSDNGIGMSPEIASQIFGMFEQADQSLERSRGGLGVGLSLARRLVELHGGSLSAYSDGPGRGSRFTVRLPVIATPPRKSTEEFLPATAVRQHLRIMLTDDNYDFVTSMAQLLSIDGHEVQTASDANQALALVASFSPDFAFLDIGLPGMSGYALVQKLREMHTMKACVFVAVTGWGQESDRRQAAEAGFDYHLVKPVDFDQLQALLTQGRERLGSL